MPPIRLIHSERIYEQGRAKLSLEYWRTQKTDAIVRSLVPGLEQAMRVKSDGRIFNGNTRVKVLRERGFDVDTLPREILED